MSARLLGFMLGIILLGQGLAVPEDTGGSTPEGRGAASEPALIHRIKLPEETRLEAVIDKAYRRCFKTYKIGGRSLTLRIPFGQNGERNGSPGYYQQIYLGGKGEPEEVWERVDELLDSEQFDSYLAKIRRPGAKVIVFNLERKSFSVYYDEQLLELMESGPYPGTQVLVYVLKKDAEISEIDLYNYLYCIGAVGLDCSGFIYYIQKSIAKVYGVDLDEVLARGFRTSPNRAPRMTGLWFFDPESGHGELVDERIENLRPGDVFLFRGRDYVFRHSAVIQSIDFEKGTVRYVQCTDWAPQAERGVHDSFILFDPGSSRLRVKDEPVEWTQEIYPTFIGEPGPGYWRNDGDRYRAYQEADGSVIVRLRLIRELVKLSAPSLYENVYPESFP